MNIIFSGDISSNFFIEEILRDKYSKNITSQVIEIIYKRIKIRLDMSEVDFIRCYTVYEVLEKDNEFKLNLNLNLANFKSVTSKIYKTNCGNCIELSRTVLYLNGMIEENFFSVLNDLYRDFLLTQEVMLKISRQESNEF